MTEQQIKLMQYATQLQQLTNHANDDVIDNIHTKLFDLQNDTYFENNENMNDTEFQILLKMFDMFEMMLAHRDKIKIK
jgi:hypothetical protein